MLVTEVHPPCPGCGPRRPGGHSVGWLPCHCRPGITGHRTLWCWACRVEVLLPECRANR